MKGRKPVPTALKVLRGNPGKRPLNDAEPTPTAGIPPCPRHLDKGAKAEWRRLSKDLAALGLVSTIDRAALAAYCVSWSQWVAALEKVQALGMVVKSPQGFPIQNPYLAIANKALKHMHMFLLEFGMSPSSRARVTASAPSTPGNQVDPWAGLAANE